MSQLADALLPETRRKIVNLLRFEEQTVSDLADELGLTRNAVRAQLSKLERDDLAKQVGQRPTGRKPESVYGLTSRAERLFPKAYPTLLNEVIGLLEEEMGLEETRRLLEQVGRRIGRAHRPHELEEKVEPRLERARAVLSELGGLPTVERDNGSYRLAGRSCPVAEVVDAHGEAGCDLARALLAELTGLEVRRECQVTGGDPTCSFVFLKNRDS